MATKTLIKTKSVKISSKGQITLPKSFLQKLNLVYGDSVVINFSNSKLELFNKKEVVKNKIQTLLGSVVPKNATKLSLEQQIEDARNDHFNI